MFEAASGQPFKKRLKLMAETIHERFEADNIRGEELPKPGAILKSLNAMLRVKNTFPLYKDFTDRQSCHICLSCLKKDL